MKIKDRSVSNELSQCQFFSSGKCTDRLDEDEDVCNNTERNLCCYICERRADCDMKCDEIEYRKEIIYTDLQALVRMYVRSIIDDKEFESRIKEIRVEAGETRQEIIDEYLPHILTYERATWFTMKEKRNKEEPKRSSNGIDSEDETDSLDCQFYEFGKCTICSEEFQCPYRGFNRDICCFHCEKRGSCDISCDQVTPNEDREEH